MVIPGFKTSSIATVVEKLTRKQALSSLDI
jgi:hypothetical protein